MTLKEYLEDYASPETKEIGESLIAKEIRKVPNEKVRERAIQYLEELKEGKRFPFLEHRNQCPESGTDKMLFEK